MKETATKKLRPKFHVHAEEGWINDPNGMVVFGGRYHAFYQHYPHDVHWGPMHWGHVVSDDLVHWERLPVALYPGDEGDKNGCFSGTAIVWNDTLWIMYTGFTENGGGEEIRQVQCLASSTDGVHFKKHGVVIGEENLPKEYVYKVLDKSRADEIFSKIPAIDFEREMLILHGFTTTSHSDYKLTEVVFSEKSLVIKYGSKKKKGNQPPNASAPRTEWVVIKMDKLTADEVTVRYVGEVFGA